MRPMQLNGKTVHQIAMPFHFGSAGPVQGGATNDLVPISGEPNVTIMEAKALACNIVPGPIAARARVRRVDQEIRADRWPAEFASRTTATRRAQKAAAGRSVTANTERRRLRSMIGEGIQSTNQRKHSYVQDHVEVGFLHRPECLHRLQSLRGRVQRMEPSAR